MRTALNPYRIYKTANAEESQNLKMKKTKKKNAAGRSRILGSRKKGGDPGRRYSFMKFARDPLSRYRTAVWMGNSTVNELPPVQPSKLKSMRFSNDPWRIYKTRNTHMDSPLMMGRKPNHCDCYDHCGGSGEDVAEATVMVRKQMVEKALMIEKHVYIPDADVKSMAKGSKLASACTSSQKYNINEEPVVPRVAGRPEVLLHSAYKVE